MRLSTAQNTQNLGTFHFQDTAFKSGDSSKDRQSGHAMYTPYEHGDQVSFQNRTAPLHYAAPAQPSGLMLFIERLLSLDIRFYTSIVATVLFSVCLQAISGLNIIVVALIAVPFFLVWYVMSFFNFQRVMDNVNQAQAMRSRQHSMQIPATF